MTDEQIREAIATGSHGLPKIVNFSEIRAYRLGVAAGREQCRSMLAKMIDGDWRVRDNILTEAIENIERGEDA